MGDARQFASESEARGWLAGQEPGVRVRATRYEVSLLPEDDVNYKFFVVFVQRWVDGMWVVTRGGDECLGRDGEWAEGIKPYGRSVQWISEHRFDFDTARELAVKAAPTVTVNGITAAQVLARREQAGEAA